MNSPSGYKHKSKQMIISLSIAAVYKDDLFTACFIASQNKKNLLAISSASYIYANLRLLSIALVFMFL